MNLLSLGFMGFQEVLWAAQFVVRGQYGRFIAPTGTREATVIVSQSVECHQQQSLTFGGGVTIGIIMARLLVASMWWTYPHLRALTGTPPTTHKSIIFCSYSSNSGIHELRDHSFLQLLAGWLAGPAPGVCIRILFRRDTRPRAHGGLLRSWTNLTLREIGGHC